MNLNAAVADTCERLVAIIVLYFVSDFVFLLFLQVLSAWFNPVDNSYFFLLTQRFEFDYT